MLVLLPYIVVTMTPDKDNLQEEKLILAPGFRELQPIMAKGTWWSNTAGAFIRVCSHHSTAMKQREAGPRCQLYNLQPSDPLSSGKPHLLKVPQSLQTAPLSREQGLR